MKTASNSAPMSPARILLKTLQDQFPPFRSCLPLAIAIDKQIRVRLPDIDRNTLRATLAMHTQSSAYLRQVAKATSRFDLDGNASGEISEVHRKHAETMLQNRAAKAVELRKAQQELERQAQREKEQAESAKKQAEKLNQLLTKFSRN
jgi:ProP effector